MLGIKTEEEFQKFHRMNLDVIAQINTEFGLRDGIGGLMVKRRAKHALNQRVNEQAAQYGLQYNLEGRFLNMGDMPIEFSEPCAKNTAKT